MENHAQPKTQSSLTLYFTQHDDQAGRPLDTNVLGHYRDNKFMALAFWAFVHILLHESPRGHACRYTALRAARSKG